MKPEELTELIRQLLEFGTLDQIEREIYIVAAWDYEKPVAIAAKLGVSSPTVRQKIRRYKIPLKAFREEKFRQNKILFPKVRSSLLHS